MLFASPLFVRPLIAAGAVLFSLAGAIGASYAAEVGPFSGSAMVEEEERAQLSDTVPWRVCDGLNKEIGAWSCVLEQAESDQIIFRGGSAVSSTDGQQYCAACRLGEVIGGDDKSAYLLATTGTPWVRCVCGKR